MGESDFTNVKLINDSIVSFEKKFTYIENKAAPVIKKILNNRALNLDPMETATLHTFVVVQFLRSKGRRLDQDIFTNEIKKRFPGVEVNAHPDKISDSELGKLFTLDFTFSNLQEFVGILLMKHLYLMLRDCKDEIYISDSPLVLHNQKTFGPYGNIGLAVPGVEIYYPLSPDVVLAYMCPQTIKEIEEAQTASDKTANSFFAQKLLSANGLSVGDKITLANMRAEIARAKTYFRMIKHEGVVPFDTQNALYLNSLQVASSYRYVAARTPAFDFARKALSERPHWKEGLRIQVM